MQQRDFDLLVSMLRGLGLEVLSTDPRSLVVVVRVPRLEP